MNHLVNNALERWRGLGVSTPPVTQKDIEPLVVPLKESEVESLVFRVQLPRADPPFGSRLGLNQPRAALFLQEPYSNRLKMSVLEVLDDIVSVLPARPRVQYQGYDRKAWQELWSDLGGSQAVEGAPMDVWWCDHLLPPQPWPETSIWVQRIDWNDHPRCEEWLRRGWQRFTRVELVLSIQSGFPVPKAFVRGSGPRRMMTGVKADYREAYLRFFHDLHEIIYRSETRCEYWQRFPPVVRPTPPDLLIRHGRKLLERWSRFLMPLPQSPTYYDPMNEC